VTSAGIGAVIAQGGPEHECLSYASASARPSNLRDINPFVSPRIAARFPLVPREISIKRLA